MKKLVVCLVMFGSCAAVQLQNDPSRAVVAVRSLEGGFPKDGVLVCRVKEGASEWGCMRLETLQKEIADEAADGGSI